MIKSFQIAIGIVMTATALAHAQGKINYTPNKQKDAQVVQLQPNQNTQNIVPWVVSVVHRVDVHKLIERTRKQLKAKVGVPGSLQQYIFNFTTGMVIDDKGHIVTRLWNLDPQDKEQTITVVTNNGANLPAKFIGLDCASGFAVLEVANLNMALPVAAGNFLKDKAVKILSVDLIQKDAATDNRTGVYVVPEIRTLTGQVEAVDVEVVKDES